MNRPKNIPTILGLAILLVGTIAGVRLISVVTSPFTKASGDCRPINVQVTNLTHQSVDISFTTSAVCDASIDIDSRLISDSRKLGTDEVITKTHYFQVDNLRENTTYSFNIISGGANYSQTSNSFKTATKPPGQIPVSNLAWGRVLTSGQQPAAGAIVYLTIPGGYPLSALVTTQGNWSISLANSLDLAKKNWFTPPDNTYEDFVIFFPDNEPTLLTGNTSQNNPVPDIIIGSTSLIQPSTTRPPGQNQYQSSASPTLTLQLQITSPQENETISTALPQFFGTAPANSRLNLNLEPSSLSVQVSSNYAGAWNWTPPSPLGNGNYTLSLASAQSSVSRHFTIDLTAVNPAFSASSSASPNTPTPSPLPSTTPTLIPTSAPATPTTTLTPTATPKPRTSLPSTESGIPTTGNTSPTVWLSLIGLTSLIIGILIIF